MVDEGTDGKKRRMSRKGGHDADPAGGRSGKDRADAPDPGNTDAPVEEEPPLELPRFRNGKLDWKRFQRVWGFDEEFRRWMKERLNVKKDLEAIYHDLTDTTFYRSNNLFETDPRKKRSVTILFQLVFPILALATSIAMIYLLYPIVFGSPLPKAALGLSVAYIIPPAGKESVIPLMISTGVHPLVVAIMMTLIDMAFSLFVTWNMDLIYRVPVFGILLRKTHVRGRAIMTRFRWIQRLAFAGIMIFVAFPLQGSGGLVATVVGKIIGMPPYRNVLAVGLGALLGSLAYAYLSSRIFDLLFNTVGKRYTFLAVGVVVIVLLLLGLGKLVNTSFKRLTEDPFRRLKERYGKRPGAYGHRKG